MIKNKQLGAFIGLIIFTIPVALYSLWILACNKASYPDNVTLYNSYLPDFLKGRFKDALLSFTLCIVAVLLNIKNLNNQNVLLKTLSWAVVIGGSLLGFLYLFSMM